MSTPPASPWSTWVRKTGASAAPDPTLRASTVDRQYYADLLGQAYAAGQLDDAEFSARVDTALKATFLSELIPLVRDLNFAALPPATTEDKAVVPPAPRALAKPPRAAKPAKRRALQITGAAAAAVAIFLAGNAIGTASNNVVYYVDPYREPYGQVNANGVGVVNYADYTLYPLEGPASELQPAINAVGNADINLSQVTIDRSTILRIHVDGHARLVLPRGNVTLRYSNWAISGGIGGVEIVGSGDDIRTGPDPDTGEVEGTYIEAPYPGDPTITIIIDLNAGNLDVLGN